MVATSSEDFENQFSDQIIQFLSRENGGSQITNQTLIEQLEKMRTDLKSTETRRGLEDYLLKFNLSINRVESVKEELTTTPLSLAGDTMVSMVCKVKSTQILQPYFYPKTENSEVNGNNMNAKETAQDKEVKLQIEMDRNLSRKEPTLCIQLLSNLRDLIHDGLVLHTELYLMGNEVQELIENVKLLNLQIPLFTESKYRQEQTNFDQIFKRESFSVCVGGVLGGIAGLMISGTFAGFLVMSLKCHCCCSIIGHALFGMGCTTCAITCLGPLLGAAAIVGLCVTLGGLAGWAWDVGQDRRKEFEEIYKFRLKLEESKVEPELRTFIDELKKIKEGVKRGLQEREGTDGAISPSQFNIIMKAYKEYRETFERAKKGFGNKTEEELHQIVRIGATGVIAPLEKSFKFSESVCWELLDAIHQIIHRDSDVL